MSSTLDILLFSTWHVILVRLSIEYFLILCTKIFSSSFFSVNSSEILHLYWILFLYIDLFSLFHSTVCFIPAFIHIFFEFLEHIYNYWFEVISSMSFKLILLGHISMGVLIFGGDTWSWLFILFVLLHMFFSDIWS